MTGRGYMESMQKLFYLPEASTDFIFSIIGEELGFIGAFLIVLLFAFLGMRGFRAAFLTKDPFARLVAFGITTTILLQSVFQHQRGAVAGADEGDSTAVDFIGGDEFVLYAGVDWGAAEY